MRPLHSPGGHGRKTPGSYPLSSTAGTQSSRGLLGMIQLPLHARCDASLPSPYGDPIDRALSCPLTSLPGQTKLPETSLCGRCPQGLSPSAQTRAPAANGQGHQCSISVGSVLRQLALNTYILKTRSLLEVG